MRGLSPYNQKVLTELAHVEYGRTTPLCAPLREPTARTAFGLPALAATVA